MKALITTAFVLALAAPASAQDAPQDPLKDCKLGDRVELTLKSGFAVSGQIVTVDPRITELEKMTVITLDIALEVPELTGHLGVERSQIKSVRKLPKLTPADLEAREKARQAALKRMSEDDGVRRAKAAERELELEKERAEKEKAEKGEKVKGVLGDVKEQAELIEKGGALFAKFPPPEWGPKKLEEIGNKNTLRLPLTDEEREFLLNYDLWAKYKAYQEQEELKEKLKDAAKGEKKDGEKKDEEKKNGEEPPK